MHPIRKREKLSAWIPPVVPIKLSKLPSQMLHKKLDGAIRFDWHIVEEGIGLVQSFLVVE